MRTWRRVSITCFVLVLFALPLYAQSGTCSGLSLGRGASLNGFVPFPADNLWNTDISSAPVDPNSSNYINFIGKTATLHPDFGAGTYDGQYMGIPYQVEASTEALVNVKLGMYGSESDPGPMPIPSNALIEGYPKPDDGDRHVLVLEKGGCWLFELYNASLSSAGVWSANSTAIWDMTIDEQRPYTWTSADAAGLPIFVGLARYDEVAAGAIHHALRFTVPTTQQAFVLPATHWASSNTDSNAPPMGLRLRLKADFDISGYPADDQVILTCLKTYGLILADNGSAIYITGTPDKRWNNDDLSLLKQITAADFEVVDTGTVYTPDNVPSGASPKISKFTANPATAAAKQLVTLSWTTSGQVYNIISPQVGPVRGSSIIIRAPASTTTYTLYSTNQYGRTKKSVKLTVP
ncbi:MAG TPA: hypothetical protein VKO18_10240 [Terriglobia bacterium]|nr:hypothetical protein [Terriglobia bacterium]